MHVLPLPFGLALAVLPRRDADQLRPERKPEYNTELRSVTSLRERVYAQSHRPAA